MCSSPYNMTLRYRGEQSYSCTVSLTLALEEVSVCGPRYVPFALPSGNKTPVIHCTRGCVVLEASLEGCGKHHPTEIRTPDRPARGESLYRLR